MDNEDQMIRITVRRSVADTMVRFIPHTKVLNEEGLQASIDFLQALADAVIVLD